MRSIKTLLDICAQRSGAAAALPSQTLPLALEPAPKPVPSAAQTEAMRSVRDLLADVGPKSRPTPLPQPSVLSAAKPADERPFEGHQATRRPRVLTEKQKNAFPFLSEAVERVQHEVKHRGQRWLRRLDHIHASGCRTKQQCWDAVGILGEPLLARLDIATLCCGWLDDTGTFRLNRQKGLAEDTGLTESRVSRALHALTLAGYVRKRVRRIHKHGQRWICRVTLHLRPRFFIDLGLGHQLAQARTRAKKRRDRQLKEAGVRQQQQALHELTARQRRNESRRRAEGKRRFAEQEQVKAVNFEYQKRRAEVLAQLVEAHPDMPHVQLIEALNQRYPLRPS